MKKTIYISFAIALFSLLSVAQAAELDSSAAAVENQLDNLNTIETGDDQYAILQFSETDIILQGNWLIELGEDTKRQAEMIYQMAPQQQKVVEIIYNNGSAISEKGGYLIDNKDSISAPESIQATGGSLKEFGNSLFLASDLMKRQSMGDTDIIDKLGILGESLQTAGAELDKVGYEGYLNGDNINVEKYEESLRNVTILYDSYRALKRGYLQNAKVEAKIISSKAKTSTNYTHQIIYFDGTGSSDPNGTINLDTGYFWDFGDGTFGTGAFVSHKYSDPNKYVVKLMVNGPSGFDLETSEIKVDAVYPVAVITSNKESLIGPHPKEMSVYAEEPIQFSATGSFDPAGKTDLLSFEWDFGDGSRSTGEGNEITSHAFSKPGEYDVTLVASVEKLSNVTEKHIIVLPVPPTAKFKIRKSDETNWNTVQKDFFSETIGNGLELEFDASPSVGAPLNEAKTRYSEIVQYEWNFGDGEKETQNLNNIKAGTTVKHTYKVSGVYTVSLSIKDTNGSEDSQIKTVYISDMIQPVADISITPEKDITTHSLITLDATESRTLEGRINLYSWEILDANRNLIDSYKQEIVTFTPEKPGTFEVRLQVKNSSGVESPTIIQKMIVESAPPVANFSVEFKPDSANEVTLDASLSSDPDPDDVLTYSWDFNSDGEYDIFRFSQPTTSRIFDKVGQNEITLTVTDTSGKTDTTSQVLYIESTLMAKLKPINSEAIGHVPYTVNMEAHGFYNLFSGADHSSIRKIVWDFDDNSPEVTDTNLMNGKSTQKHKYDKPGRYKIKITVYDAKNNTAEAFYPVHVGDGVSPIAAITMNPPSGIGTTKTEFDFDASKSVSSEGTITNLGFSWDFGDDSTIESGDQAFHRYPEIGVYYLTLSVTDYSSNQISKLVLPIEVKDAPSVANFIASPLTAPTDKLIFFNASSSFDPDNEITEYRWDFGDGKIERTPKAETYHVYKKSGTYKAKVIILNDAGVQTESKDVIITIN